MSYISNISATSQDNGGQSALDVGINVSGIQVDPRSIRPLVSGTDSVAAIQSGAWTVNQGSAALPSDAWYMRITDGATTVGITGFSLNVNVTNLSIPVSQSGAWSVAVNNFPATQPISGTVTADQGTSPWVVTGTVAATQSGAWTVAAAQSGTWVLGANSGVDIGDVTVNNAAGASAVNIQDGGNSITVDGSLGRTWTLSSGTDSVAAVQSGTWTVQQGSAPWSQNLTQVGGASVTLGQKTMANSIPVVLPSDQSVSISGTISVANTSGTATVSTVSVSTTAVIVLAANSNRKSFHVTNIGGNTLYIGYNNAVTSSSYTARLNTSIGTEEFKAQFNCYTGDIYAIRGSGTSNVLAVEFT